MTASDSQGAAAGHAVAPILVFSCGNPSRGDDALGPLFSERIEALAAHAPWRAVVETLTDFQWQVEHVLDLVGRRQVVFVDADVAVPEPFGWSGVLPKRDATFSSHVMSPAALLEAYVAVCAEPPPPCFALRVRAHAFDLGKPPGLAALGNLDAATKFFLDWLEGILAADAPAR